MTMNIDAELRSFLARPDIDGVHVSKRTLTSLLDRLDALEKVRVAADDFRFGDLRWADLRKALDAFDRETGAVTINDDQDALLQIVADHFDVGTDNLTREEMGMADAIISAGFTRANGERAYTGDFDPGESVRDSGIAAQRDAAIRERDEARAAAIAMVRATGSGFCTDSVSTAFLAHGAEEVATLRAERDALARHTGNLLARIHGDGGHYEQEHGTEKAVEDAHKRVAAMFARAEAAEAAEADLDRQLKYLEAHNQAWSDRCDAAESRATALAEALREIARTDAYCPESSQRLNGRMSKIVAIARTALAANAKDGGKP